jgi:ATP-binding protein involved in chromosome partitioning
MTLRDAVLQALSTVEDPEIHLPITDLGMVKSVEISGSTANISVFLTIKGCPMRDTISTRVRDAVMGVDGIDTVNVTLDVMSEQQLAELKTKIRGPQKTIQFAEPTSTTKIFAIASGKGGVGKSSVTVNLAIAFANKGLSVGIIDADVYGHSIPGILGLTENPTYVDKDLRMPPQSYGVKALSMLAFKPGGKPEPIAFRGPMLAKVLEQFLTDFYWGELDVLLLDLPPGTGDIAISTAQLLPLAQLVVVTTPQIAAADVAVRAGMMAQLTKQKVAGVIENMSAVTCPKCGESMALFGEGGGEVVAQQLTEALGTDTHLLGKIPFDVRLREGGDNGQPLVATDPDAAASQVFASIADALYAKPRGLAGIPLKLTPTK